jgi:integrase/recombinase XerD
MRHTGLIPRYTKLPWIPNETEWTAILQAARQEPLRNRTMLALGYDAGLRREELCRLEVRDIDPSQRLLRIRFETTKSRRERVVPYSEPTATLYMAYLQERAEAESSTWSGVCFGVQAQPWGADLHLDLVKGR